MTLHQAIEVSVHGFAAGKSLHYPYAVRSLHGLYHLADSPPRKDSRKEEVFAVERSPEEVVAILREAGLGWHFLCDVVPIDADPKARKAAYKALGYRAMATEWVFVHNLQDIPVFECDPPARWVHTAEEWAGIPQHTRQKRKWVDGFRQYGAWDAAASYGWAESRPHGEHAYTADVYVHPEHRGRGLGRALMSRLLRDDREQGLRGNALIASTAGARLYPHLGYRLLGTLQIFCPTRRETT